MYHEFGATGGNRQRDAIMTAAGTFPSLTSPSRRCGGRSSTGMKRPRNTGANHTCRESGPTEIRNPRALFPVRDDFIRSAWVQRSRTQRAQDYEELYPYFLNHPSAVVLRGSSTVSPTAAVVTSAARPTPETQAIRAPSHRQQQPSGVPSAKVRAKGAAPVSRAGARSQRHMDVGTGPGNVAELRRAFRRLEPENMFRAPRVEEEPIWAYWGGSEGGREEGGYGHGQSQPPLPPGKRASTKDGFVLVPAAELAELRAIEAALRKERGVLKAHCLIAFNGGEVSAHRPLELTRMAVHGACGSEMADALQEYRTWMTRSSGGRDKKGKSVAPRVALAQQKSTVMAAGGGGGKRSREAASKERMAELQRTPAGWRTLRWMMMKSQAELKSQAAEAAAMFAEEMEQRLKERYLEAWERQHDYDLYCVLAGQFWPLEAEAFRACARPGKKLFLEVEAPARVIIRMWRTLWPFRKDRKRKGCLGLQALWRGHHVRKRWRPIVRLRTRHGRRSILRPCFSSWARVARVHRWARRRFEEIEGHWERACFRAWAEWVADLAAEKQRKLERAGRTLRNIAAYRSFQSWQLYTRTTRQAQRLYARTVGGTSMAAWIQYVDEARRQRKRGGAAVTIQRHARGYLARGRYRATRAIIQGFNRLMSARRARQFLRQALAAAHRFATEELLQSGYDAEITVGVVREEKRLAKMQKELKAVDAAVRRAVTKRLGGGWLTSRPSSRGGGELRREIQAVRKEWKALEAEAAAATGFVRGTTPTTASASLASKSTGGGGGGGFGGTWPKLGFPGILARKGKPKDIGSRVGDDGDGGGGSSPTPEAKTGAVSTAEGTTEGGGAEGEQAPAKVPVSSHSAGEADREARRRILSRERDLARELVMHDFDVLNPPPLKCCAPGCGRTFTHDEHYLAHWDTTFAARGLLLVQHERDAACRPSLPPSLPGTPHRGEATGQRMPSAGRAEGSTTSAVGRRSPPPAEQPRGSLAAAGGAEAGHPELGGEDVASFHLVVADKAERGERHDDPAPDVVGFDLVSAYITRVWGRGQAYSTLMFIDAVEAWRRRCLAAEPAFAEGAADLRREYLCPGAPREASLPEGTWQDLMRVLEALPEELLDPAVAGGQDDRGAGGADGDAGGGEAGGGKPDVELGDKKHRGGAKGASENKTRGRFGRNKIPGPAVHQQRQQQPRTASVATAGQTQTPATISAAAAAARNPQDLRPTSFDKAQFEALAHLCRVVGPGFWASDLGRRATSLRLKNLKKNREAAHEIVRLERKGRLANEAAEVRKQLSHGRDMEMESLAQSAVGAAFDSILEALLRSAVAGAKLLEIHELEMAREKDMLVEAATVEAVWAVEPPLLEDLLGQEIDALCSEGEERELMSLEDDWVLPEIRLANFRNGLSTAIAYPFDLTSIPGGAEGACQAATTIQLAWRQRSARVEARRRLAQVYVKRVGARPGEVYYEHTVTGESQWERPLIAYRLFPYSSW